MKAWKTTWKDGLITLGILAASAIISVSIMLALITYFLGD